MTEMLNTNIIESQQSSNIHQGIFGDNMVTKSSKQSFYDVSSFLLRIAKVSYAFNDFKLTEWYLKKLNKVITRFRGTELYNEFFEFDNKYKKKQLMDSYNELKKQADNFNILNLETDLYINDFSDFNDKHMPTPNIRYVKELKNIADTIIWEANNDNLFKGIADREKYISMLRHIGRKSLSLFRDYELMHEIDFNNYRPEMSRIDINAVVSDLKESFIHHAASKSINVEFIMSSQNLEAMINFEKTSECLFNIFHNACKFTKNNGNIRIKTFLQNINNTECVVIEISDNGIGINKELLPHLFKRFSKASRPGTNSEKTSGLGLYITKRLIELQNGNINVMSAENIGTCFKITFEKLK